MSTVSNWLGVSSCFGFGGFVPVFSFEAAIFIIEIGGLSAD